MNYTSVYYPYFDYLRIILAIIVMLSHDNIIAWGPSGNLSVQIFFALSGWLIGGILLKLPHSELPRFYFNRALRIWIPYYLALALLIVASILRDPINLKWIEFVFYKFCFVYNIFGSPQLEQFRQSMPQQGTGHHFWSVNAEEQFYLVAPLLLILITPKISRNILVWSATALAAWLTNIYASIVFGVLAAIVVYHYGPVHNKKSLRYALLGSTLITFVAILLDFNYNIFAPLFSVSLVLLLAIKGEQDSIGAFLGGISYPLYLNHWIGVFVANAILTPFGLQDTAARKLIGIIVALAIASGLYWWIDRHIVALRSKLFSRRRGLIAIVMTYGLTVVGILGGSLFQKFSY